MTSNIASQQIQKLTEEAGEDWEIEAHVKDALRQHFKPEFLNRIDEIVVFHMLTKEDLEKNCRYSARYIWPIGLRNANLKLNLPTMPASC